jgi:hypothetical protein
MPERYPIEESQHGSEMDEEREAFAIGCLQRMIERSDALKKRLDFAEAIRRLETGAARATLEDAARGLANV